MARRDRWNLLGVMLLPVIRLGRRMHPVAFLKSEMKRKDIGGAVTGLVVGMALGVVLSLVLSLVIS